LADGEQCRVLQWHGKGRLLHRSKNLGQGAPFQLPGALITVRGDDVAHVQPPACAQSLLHAQGGEGDHGVIRCLAGPASLVEAGPRHAGPNALAACSGRSDVLS
jgi:hypothetical protein